MTVGAISKEDAHFYALAKWKSAEVGDPEERNHIFTTEPPPTDPRTIIMNGRPEGQFFGADKSQFNGKDK